MRKKLFCVAVVTGVLGGLYGCGGGGSSLSSAVTTAHVRFINSGPDSTSLNFALNTTVDAAGLKYLTSTPSFINYSPETYDISAEEVSGTEDLANDADALSANTSYLVIGYGLENYTGPDGPEIQKRFDVTPVSVDVSVPNGGLARIIVFAGFIQQFGYDTPTIDFQDVETSGTPQYPLTNIAFGSTATELVTPGSFTFEVLRDGTTMQYATASAFTFVAGKTYLALVSGIEGATGAEAPQIKFISLD
jgi:hypothetical protein